MTLSLPRFLAASITCGMQLFALPAVAQDPPWCGRAEPHALDSSFALAIERSGGVTADMRDAQGEAYEGWQRELERLYTQLLAQYGDDARARTLRNAQHAWTAWDAAEAENDNAVLSDQGTSGPLQASALAIERRRTRACTFRIALDDLALDGPGTDTD